MTRLPGLILATALGGLLIGIAGAVAGFSLQAMFERPEITEPSIGRGVWAVIGTLLGCIVGGTTAAILFARAVPLPEEVVVEPVPCTDCGEAIPPDALNCPVCGTVQS